MAFTATLSTKEPRAFSVGPVRFQLYTYTAVSGDTTGTLTAVGMFDRVDNVIVDGGLVMTAAPTFSGNVVTLAFSDPLANRFGTILVVGI